MNLSFEFNASRVYPFGQEQPEKSFQIRPDSESEETKFLSSLLKKPENLNLSKDSGKVQAILKDSKESKENNINEPNSKKEVEKVEVANPDKISKSHSVPEKSEISNNTSKESKISLPPGVPAEMRSLLVPKVPVEKKEQVRMIKPPSVNRPIQAKKQYTGQIKPSNLPPNNILMANRPPETQSKQFVSSSNNVFGNSRVQEAQVIVQVGGVSVSVASNRIFEHQSKPSIPSFPPQNNMFGSVPPQNNIFRNSRAPNTEIRPPPLSINGQPAVNYFGGSVVFGDEVNRPPEVIKKPELPKEPVRHNPFSKSTVQQAPNVFQRLAPSNPLSQVNQHLNNQRSNTFYSTARIQNPFNQPREPIPRAFSTTNIQPMQQVARRPEPCLYPLRIQREWEEAHGKKWHQLKSHEVAAAKESMKKRVERQNMKNAALKNIPGGNNPNIFLRNSSTTGHQQVSRKSAHNPFSNNNHDKEKNFRF